MPSDHNTTRILREKNFQKKKKMAGEDPLDPLTIRPQSQPPTQTALVTTTVKILRVVAVSMPGIGAMDPAHLEAQARAELGFSRRLEQPRRISPYPGLGGIGGYAVWYCEQQLQRFNASEGIDVSLISIYRWADKNWRGCMAGSLDPWAVVTRASVAARLLNGIVRFCCKIMFACMHGKLPH